MSKAVIKLAKNVKFGTFVVAGDAHYWPGKPSTGHRALCYFLKMNPVNGVVLTGDMLDAPTVSTHPPIGWEKFPTLEKEIKVCQARLEEIATSACLHQKDVPLVWCLGNHDARFNKTLAAKVPQFKNLPGTSLSDFFPNWESCWRAEIGGAKGVVIKHEFKGGSNPAKSNTLASGRSIITGHHHSQNVTAFTDYNGTRYGVDAGCLAAIDGPQFSYGQANPSNWRSGFVILRFQGGVLLPPSLVTVLDEKKGIVHHDGMVSLV